MGAQRPWTLRVTSKGSRGAGVKFILVIYLSLISDWTLTEIDDQCLSEI